MIKLPIRNRWIVIALSSISLCVIAYVFACHYREESNHKLASTWIHVEPQPVTLTLGLVGKIVPTRKVSLTAPFAGTIAELRVADGSLVQAQDTLTVLDTSLIEQQRREAYADALKSREELNQALNWEQDPEVMHARRSAQTAQIQLADVERKLKDAAQLFARGIIPRVELEALQQQEILQRMELTSSEADLASLIRKNKSDRISLADLASKNASEKLDAVSKAESQNTLLAPFTGVVKFLEDTGATGAHTPLSVGTKVGEGQALFEVSSVDDVSVEASVNEIDVGKLAVGQNTQVSGDGFPEFALKGKIASISQISSDLNNAEGGASYAVRVALPGLSKAMADRIRIGMSARLMIELYRSDSAYVVPTAALQAAGDVTTVKFRANPHAPSQQISVKVLHAVPGGVEISGILSGDVDVSENATALSQP
jgi:HlyD family secretion protein